MNGTVSGQPPVSRTIAALSASLCTLLYTIDQTIANVALPHIQGNLQATQDQSLWVLTSYIVLSAIMTPLAGYLAVRHGERPVLLASVAGFTVASMGCGVSTSLVELVAFRALQGAFGAALIPISQAVILKLYSREEAARAIGFWSVSVIVGPVLGPTLGGWLTDVASWRWVFFINVPVGLLAWVGLAASVPRGASAPDKRFDALGFALLSLALLALQLMLDRGNDRGWFESNEIVTEALVAGVAAYMFVAHSATTRHPFFEPRLFRDRNLVAVLCLMVLSYPVIMVPSALMPAFLQHLEDHTPLTAGLVLAPRGISLAAAMLSARWYLNRADPRLILLSGLAIVTLATWQFAHVTPDVSATTFGVLAAAQGFGMGMLFVTMNTVGFATLGQDLRTEGAVVATLSRAVSGSIALSLFGALLSRSTVTNHARLTESITPYASEASEHLQRLPAQAGWPLLDMEITRQANVIAYDNAFAILSFLVVLAVIPVLLFRPPSQAREAGRMIAE